MLPSRIRQKMPTSSRPPWRKPTPSTPSSPPSRRTTGDMTSRCRCIAAGGVSCARIDRMAAHAFQIRKSRMPPSPHGSQNGDDESYIFNNGLSIVRRRFYFLSQAILCACLITSCSRPLILSTFRLSASHTFATRHDPVVMRVELPAMGDAYYAIITWDDGITQHDSVMTLEPYPQTREMRMPTSLHGDVWIRVELYDFTGTHMRTMRTTYVHVE